MDSHPLAELFMLRGAIASVALSHPESCTCEVCKASHGDEAAMERVMRTMLTAGR